MLPHFQEHLLDVGQPYFDKGDGFSATVNKYLDEHGLKQSPRHTVYSLRHGFKDRLREAETPDELKDGHGLRLKLKYVGKIALRPMMPEYAPLKAVRSS